MCGLFQFSLLGKIFNWICFKLVLKLQLAQLTSYPFPFGVNIGNILSVTQLRGGDTDGSLCRWKIGSGIPNMDDWWGPGDIEEIRS